MSKEHEQKISQVGFALNLLINRFTFGAITDAERALLGFRPDQYQYVNLDSANARAFEIVVCAIVGEEVEVNEIPEIVGSEQATTEEEVYLPKRSKRGS